MDTVIKGVVNSVIKLSLWASLIIVVYALGHIQGYARGRDIGSEITADQVNRSLDELGYKRVFFLIDDFGTLRAQDLRKPSKKKAKEQADRHHKDVIG